MSTSRKRAVSAVVRVIVAGILLVFMVYPIFYVIMSSMKTKDDFRHLPSWALPSAFNIDNYIKVFTTSPMLNYFKNSIIITVGVLIPLLLFSFMAGFALSKIQFKWNKKLLAWPDASVSGGADPTVYDFFKAEYSEYVCGGDFTTDCIFSVVFHPAVLFIQQVSAR